MKAILVRALLLLAAADIGQLASARHLFADGVNLQDSHVFVVNGHSGDSSEGIAITIDPRDTIAKLKSAIKDADGTPKELQSLVFNGEFLEDAEPLSHYGISCGSTVLIYKGSGCGCMIKLRVKVFGLEDSEYTTTVEIDEAQVVRKLKDIIAGEIGVAAREQKLFVKDYKLDDWNPLMLNDGDEVKITIDSRIHPRVVEKIFEAKPKVQDQIIVKTLTGKTFTVDFAQNYFISDLKNKIKEKTGIREDLQRLIFDGEQLDDEQLLKIYGIRPNSTLDLVVRSEMKLKIRIIGFHGSEFVTNIKIDPKASISDLKNVIKRESGLAARKQKLFVWGHELEDWRDLEEYYPIIRDGMQIKLVVDSTIEIDESDKLHMRQSRHLIPRDKFEQFFGKELAREIFL